MLAAALGPGPAAPLSAGPGEGIAGKAASRLKLEKETGNHSLTTSAPGRVPVGEQSGPALYGGRRLSQSRLAAGARDRAVAAQRPQLPLSLLFVLGVVPL